MTASRLITLKEARQLLGGLHPSAIGVQPIMKRWDRRAIDAALDRIAGLASPAAPAAGEAQDDGADEITALAERIARAARRA